MKLKLSKKKIVIQAQHNDDEATNFQKEQKHVICFFFCVLGRKKKAEQVI